MTLAEYLAQPGVTATDLAVKCGVSVSTISRLARGVTGPRKPLMAVIKTHTKGKVTPDDFEAKQDA